MKRLKNYIKSQARDFISYDKWTSVLSIVLLVIFLTNEIQEIYLSNPPYFLESLFRYTNIFYFLSLGLVIFILYKRSLFFFFILLVFYLDFFFQLKRYIQSILLAYSVQGNLVNIYAVVFIILISLVIIIFFVPHRYLIFFSYFILFFYSFKLLSFQFTASQDSLPKHIKPDFRVDSLSRNFYVFLFDEYPSYESFAKNFPYDRHQHVDLALKSKGFISYTGIYSNYTVTEGSVTSFLTGALNDSISVNNAIEALRDNIFTHGKNYSFHSFSIFSESYRKNSFITTQLFRGINCMMSRYFAPYIISKFYNRGVGNFTNYTYYHNLLIRKLKSIAMNNDRKVFFGHFLTPHYYPLVLNQNFNERLDDANNWMMAAIGVVHKYDSTASILIISDHGLRLNRIPSADHNKNILYYKNLSIDTVELEKQGLYKLIETINFD